MLSEFAGLKRYEHTYPINQSQYYQEKVNPRVFSEKFPISFVNTSPEKHEREGQARFANISQLNL